MARGGNQLGSGDLLYVGAVAGIGWVGFKLAQHGTFGAYAQQAVQQLVDAVTGGGSGNGGSGSDALDLAPDANGFAWNFRTGIVYAIREGPVQGKAGMATTRDEAIAVARRFWG